ncbi:malonate decarboxylase acyl carrier protein [Ancylobacter pratisalsi]|uniref:Malonate decarboxylase acyl carrier protein n=1 Tax=Ancylobacter pratisalsi TaxID=1745854 RepID=A0A6P1YJU1_9HYPH|nr:malonate decarboxylase acyl carrier protein [Ancylobacter pratisalsi]QIB32976.1 malonate decarboxylase acyl carrier protein [Ancylobacter pratisalsi]
MERLEFRFAGRPDAPVASDGEVLVGVVGSGNLEVMIEQVDLGGACLVAIDTSINGFRETWESVLTDFVARHRLGNIRVSINDGGATPAVVALRLDQALANLGKQR